MTIYSGINQGGRDWAIRLQCEKAIYDFITDYANDMGMSRSSTVRRLVLIGAYCEANHSAKIMPKTYEEIKK